MKISAFLPILRARTRIFLHFITLFVFVNTRAPPQVIPRPPSRVTIYSRPFFVPQKNFFPPSHTSSPPCYFARHFTRKKFCLPLPLFLPFLPTPIPLFLPARHTRPCNTLPKHKQTDLTRTRIRVERGIYPHQHHLSTPQICPARYARFLSISLLRINVVELKPYQYPP